MVIVEMNRHMLRIIVGAISNILSVDVIKIFIYRFGQIILSAVQKRPKINVVTKASLSVSTIFFSTKIC